MSALELLTVINQILFVGLFVAALRDAVRQRTRTAFDRLRQAFARWGLPGQLRVDNGAPWGSKGDLPTDLALWLLGLGIDLHWNRPGQATDNAVVERGHGVGANWAEPQAHPSAAALERRLAAMDRIQREEYPSIGRRSRLEAYPALAHSGRPYRPAGERRQWSLPRVLDYLAGLVGRGRLVGLQLAKVDGQPAQTSPLAPALEAAGFGRAAGGGYLLRPGGKTWGSARA